MSHLNEIFYQGKMVNLQNMEEAQTTEILSYVRNRQMASKEKIRVCLDRMRKN